MSNRQSSKDNPYGIDYSKVDEETVDINGDTGYGWQNEGYGNSNQQPNNAWSENSSNYSYDWQSKQGM